MPTYDFRCEDGHTFEHVCKIAELDLPVACTHDGCAKPAAQVIGGGHLNHGIGCFGDADKEGRFDENNLSSRYMSSGRAAAQNKGR
ncbi:MAG: zinc ribbon domain-containing protein [Salinibacterium sp.]|nr:MAG: zinc ribbon domain-containing protein [Salinibacterium sp.]